MPESPARGSSLGRARRPRARPGRATALLLLAVQAVALLAGCTDHPAPPNAASAPATAQAGLVGLLDARLGAQAAAIDALLGGDPLHAAAPRTLGEVLARARPGVAQLPVPHPARDGALAEALRQYGAQTGVPVPSAQELASKVAPLGMDGDAEYALAQLVMAYTQALHLQAAATAALTPAQRLLASGDPAAAQAWLADHPEGSADTERARLLGLVDMDATFQAADLLARTMDEARGPLGHSAAPLTGSAAHLDPWQVLRDTVTGGRPSAPLPATPADLRLADALQALAAVYGLPPASVPMPSLPPSLDHAVAILVQAKADSAGMPDARQAALRMLGAAQEAQPTLQAWADLLALGEAPQPAVDRAAVLRSALVAAPDAAAIVAAVHGHAARNEAIPSLRALLSAHGLRATDAAQVEATLPAAAAEALGHLLHAHDALQAARQAAFGDLSAQQQALLAATPVVPDLLSQGSWNATEAAAIGAWARAMAAVSPSALAGLQAAQEDALAEVGAAAHLLEKMVPLAPAPQSGPTTPSLPTLPPGVPPVPPAPTVPKVPPPACPKTAPFTDCANDIWFQYTDSRGFGILVTGFGSTRIDARFAGGAPNLILDLGGDDDYRVPVGAGLGIRQPVLMAGDPQDLSPQTKDKGPQQIATDEALLTLAFAGQAVGNAENATLSGDPFGVGLDAGGNDTYASIGIAGEGAAIGYGALGVLWDLGGNDLYRHQGNLASFAQGAGTLGGVGVLVDQGGADRYEAPLGFAQGVSDIAGAHVNLTRSADPTGGNPVSKPGAGGIGLLLDTGPGADSYLASAGQGYAGGNGTAGLLIDTDGPSSYTADGGEAFQGGRAGPGGLGALIDLNATGDHFSNPSIPATAAVFARPGQSLTRHKDTVWVDPDNALGIGIDSSLNDTDGNGLPDLVDTLGSRTTGSAAQQLADTVAGLMRDSDGDGYPDGVEQRAGSDPSDPHSTPPQGPQGMLLDDQLLCNQVQPNACVAANRGAPYACDPALPLACLSLLTLGGIGATAHGHPALVSVDLGGSDTYATAVAATYRVAEPASRRDNPSPSTVNATGFSLDLGGNDRYLAPDLAGTQAAATAPGAAILLDLEGNDRYAAGERSQAAALGDRALALLADFNGTDSYEGGIGSQAQVACPQGCSSLAALVDLAGDDTYSFERQAVATGGTALLLDFQGRDRYGSRLPVQEQGLSPSHPNDAFASQGNATANGTAVFLDAGNETDAYAALGANGPVDLTAIKDNVVLHNNSPGKVADAAQAPKARFADNLQGALADSDGDGSAGWLELVAGTRPNDPTDSPGTTNGLADCENGNATACSPDPVLATPNPGQAILGDPGVQLAEGLLVGGPGDSVYRGVVPPFLVDLGGNDVYASPGFGAATGRGAVGKFLATLGTADAPLDLDPGVTLVLDAGAGDDVYAPRPCLNQTIVADTTPFVMPACPSLAAASLGIAVLGDDGGVNRFESRMLLNGTVQGAVNANVTVSGLSQGAAAADGVGILATWNASNTFLSTVVADLQRTGAAGGSASGIVAHGNTQGAGIDGGLGVLASLGGGSDTYSSATVARIVNRDGTILSGTALDRAQGAGLGDPTVINKQGAQAPGGTGVLFDGGGSNQFSAPAGQAQGAALGAGSHGILWSGPGNDAYLAGPLSQAATMVGGPIRPSTGLQKVDQPPNVRGMAVLADIGGSDTYTLAGPGCENADGNGQGSGVGALLLDLAGDDRHEASACTLVQGAGDGLLVDLGGNDVYRAAGNAQGDSSGLLLDLAGADAYLVGPGAVGQGSGGTFVDAGGNDTYLARPGSKMVAGSAVPGAPAGNEQAWTQGSGVGVDAAGLEDALAALGADPSGTKVTLEIPGNGARPLGGTIPLWANVTVPQGLAVERVSFLLNGVPLGDGRRVGAAADNRFEFDLDTAQATSGTADFPDGRPYVAQAYAFVAPAGPAGLPHPDLHSVPSNQQALAIDNAPLLAATLEMPGAPPQPGISPAQAAILHVSLSRDRAFPPGHEVAGQDPGATLALRLLLGGAAHTLLTKYLPAGSTALEVRDPLCEGVPCPDGAYTLEANATDAAGHSTIWTTGLLLDGTPPTSAILLPRHAGGAFKLSESSASVPLASGDSGSGVASVTVFVLRNAGTPAAPAYVVDHALATVSAATPSVPIGGLDEEPTVALLSVATDKVGNQESRCAMGETATPCWRAKLAEAGNATVTTFDFLAPSLANAHVTPLYARPGTPVEFAANLTDDGAGVAGGVVTLDDGFTHALQHGTGDAFAYDGWSLTPDNLARRGTEGAYVARFIATDLAGNTAEAPPVKGYVDDRAPRFLPYPDGQAVRVSYTDDSGAPPASVGRPGVTARIDATLEDLSPDAIAGLTANFTSLGGGAVPCAADLGAWSCLFPIPVGHADGNFTVPLTATDKAGNANTTLATVRVHGEAFGLRPDPPLLLAVGPGSFTLHWDTDIPATTQVSYGKTSELKHQQVDSALVLSHNATVDHLDPATTYYVRAVATSAAGVVVQSDVMAVETGHGFQVALPGFTAQPRGGSFPVAVRVTDLAGLGPAQVRLMLQDAEGLSSPFEVDHGQGLGTLALSVNATNLDGAYRLVVEGTRGDDLVQLLSDPFRIDNTAPVLTPLAPLPAAVVASRSPDFRLQVIDPQAPAPGPAGLEASLDGHPLPLQVVENTTAGDGAAVRNIGLRSTQDISEGRHAVAMRLADAAGNVGSVQWNFTIDTLAPTLAEAPRITSPGGAPAAQPGANVTVALNLTDPHGVAAAFLDLGDVGGATVPLLLRGAAWEATFPAPSRATGDILVIGTDGVGNSGVGGTFRIPTDAVPPTMNLSAGNPTQTSIRLHVALSEAANVTVSEGDRTVTASAAPAVAQDLLAAGLRPGRSHTLNVTATDLAGNRAAATLVVRTLDDTQPPTGVGPLQAQSDEEGTVTLRWSPATDDAGVAAYAITRTVDGARAPLLRLPANATSYADHAPPGHLAAYLVQAIDVADHLGPMATATVRVLALPHLSEATLGADRGTTDQAFPVQVLYRNPAGARAERVDLVVGDEAHRLQTQDTDCAAGCLYTGQVRLPPTSLTSTPRILFRATADGHTTELALEAAPLVRLGAQANAQGVHLGGHAAALPTAALEAVTLLALALLRRRDA